MASETAKIEGNYKGAAIGVTNDASLEPRNLRVNPSTNRLLVEVSGAGSGGTSAVDDAAFTAGTDAGTPAMGVYQGTPDAVDDNDAGVLRMTSKRALMTSLETPNGDSAMDDTNDAVKVNVVAGSAGGPSLADDAAFTVGTTAVAPIGALADDAAPDSVNEGDIGAVRMSLRRELYVQIRDAAGNERGLNIDANGALAITNAGLTELAAAIDTEVQVDVVGALPAGNNNIGDVDIASIAAGNNNIGDVDIASIAAGDNNIGNVDIVTVPTDPFGANADAASATGSISAKLRRLATDLAAVVAGSELQVDVVGALPAGTNAIGKLAANSGVDIGDVDVTSLTPGTTATALGKAEDAGHTGGDTGVFSLGVRNNTPNTALTNADADYSQLSTDMVGGIRTALYETDFAVLGTNHVKKYYTNAGSVTDGIIWSPAAGKRWYVTDLIINISAAATITLEDDKAGGDEAVMKFELAANSGVAHHFATPLFSGEDAADLLVTTTAGNVYITVCGYEI